MFGKFASQLGVSATTGYNWADPKNVPMGKRCDVELAIKIVPGKDTNVSRVIGECGPHTILTQRVQFVIGNTLKEVVDLKRC